MEDFKCNKCNSDNINFVKYKMKNGIDILRKQCYDCGYLNTLNYKRNFINNFNSIPYHDENLRNLNKEKSIQKSNIKQVLFYYSQARFKIELEYYRNVYLKSDEWNHKRQLIMDFYEWKCQECDNKATDLHHVSYDNIFKERFDDLKPLCRNCHEKQHL